MAHSGPWWEQMTGESPAIPPASQALGLEIAEVDADERTITLRFDTGHQHVNFAGTVHGGVLATMLDDALNHALAATLPADRFALTTDLHVNYLRPAPVGPYLAHGRVAQLSGRTALLQGVLSPFSRLSPADAEDTNPVATAVATSRIKSVRPESQQP